MSPHTGQDADDDRLYAILVALTGRRLTMTEVYEAVGLSRQQYSTVRSNGKLVTPNRMILAAQRLNINPVELLTECGIVAPRDAAEYVDGRRQEVAELFENPTRTTTSERRGAAKAATDTAKVTRRRRLRDFTARTDRTL